VDRRRRLEELPGWIWNTRTARWEDGFSHLLNYVEVGGNTCVPQSYKVDGYPLGAWVNTQRDFYRKGELEVDRQRRLDDLPGWTWTPLANQWEVGFSHLLRYIERHGDSRVPRSCIVDGYRLGAWVNKQRNDHSKGTLDTERERRLDEVPGWSWNTIDDQWEDGYTRLVDYVEHHGHARVPKSYTVDGYKLGSWVNRQRVFRQGGKLQPDREHRLAQLPGWIWDASGDRGRRRSR
jgi:Helicase associated domain